MSIPPDPIAREALNRAVEMVGGRERLAESLGVKSDDLVRWLSGEGHPPPAVVFAALNLVERGKRR